MATEQLPGDRLSETQEEKPSFLNKVKAKAKKLQSKIKHHGTAQEAPTSEEPHVKPEARGTTDMDMDQSDTSESDGEGKNYDIPYTPLTHTGLPQPTRPAGATVQQPQGSPFGAVSSGQSGYGAEGLKSTDMSFPNDPTVLKNEGLAKTEQAVPTNYHYFNADPEEGYRPSDDAASQRKEDVPSVLGGESAGVTPAVERLSVGSENSLSARDGSVSKDRDTELARSFEETQDSQPTVRDGSVSKDRDTELARSFEETQDSQPTARGGSVSKDRDTELARSFGETQDSKQTADDGLVELSEPSEESLLSHPVEQDRGVEKLPSHSLTPLNSLQGEESEYAGLGSQDEGFDGVSGGGNPDSDTMEVKDHRSTSIQSTDEGDHHGGYEGLAVAGVGGAATGVGHELNFSRDESLSKDGNDNSSILATGRSEQEGFQPADNSDETVSETLPTSQYESNEEGSFRSSHGQDRDQDTSSSLLAEENQDKLVSNEQSDLQSNEGEQQTLASRVTGSAYGLKNAVASKIGYGDQALSHDSTPVSEKTTESGAGAFNSADQALSADEKPVSKKASEAVSEAKNVAEDKTTPDDQTKSYTSSITDSISGLPSMLTSKLGMKGGSPASSPTSAPKAEVSPVPTATTPTSDASEDSSKRKDTPYPEHPSTATPGLFDRVSGLASTLFGGAAKPHPAAAAEGEKPAVAEN